MGTGTDTIVLTDGDRRLVEAALSRASREAFERGAALAGTDREKAWAESDEYMKTLDRVLVVGRTTVAVTAEPPAGRLARLVGVIEDERNNLRTEVLRLRLQLAACGAAAMGYAGACKRGDFGWSASLGEVMALRRQRDAAAAAGADLLRAAGVRTPEDARFILAERIAALLAGPPEAVEDAANAVWAGALAPGAGPDEPDTGDWGAAADGAG